VPCTIKRFPIVFFSSSWISSFQLRVTQCGQWANFSFSLLLTRYVYLLYICIHIYICIYTHIYICIFIYAYMYAYIYIYIYMHTYIYVYIYKYLCIHTMHIHSFQ